MAKWTEDEDLNIINDEEVPTRVTATSSTSPDISISSPCITSSCNWSVQTALKSDHLPIKIDIASEVNLMDAPNRTFVNFKKANWEGFRDYIEEKVAAPPNTSNVLTKEKFLREVITTASKIHIPSGRIPKTNPAIPSEARELITERDDIRAADPADPRLEEMNINIKEKIDEHKKNTWLEHLDSCPSGSKRLWDTIKSLSSIPRPPAHQSIHFKGKPYHDPLKIANQLNKQYTPGATTKPTKPFRGLLRELQKPIQKDPDTIFSPQQTFEVIKKSKNSKAIGPDGMSPMMLKKLGPRAISYITEIFNDVLKTSITPPIWKTGRIIPLLKPGKPADEGKSYRPVSLLSPLAKTLEASHFTEY